MINDKKVIAFVCECNPFHKGHKKLITMAKKEGDILIAIMSGNFVQRGEPAIYDKYRRTKDLLANGVDIVIELPIEYTLSSAKYFALYSIAILNKLKFVDKLIFGSNINNIDTFNNLLLLQNDKSFDNKLKSALVNGMSYPKALSECYGISLSPNDILGLEYISAIKTLKSKIIPICIKRDTKLKGASELRKKIKPVITNNTFSNILNYKLLKSENSDLLSVYNITNDLYNSIIKNSNKNISFDERATLLNTKNRTLANIKRALLCIILDIKKKNVNVASFNKEPKYIRILGINNNSLKYLKSFTVPYLLSYAPNSYKSFIKNFPNSKEVRINKKGEFILSQSIMTNIFASNIYNVFSNNGINELTIKTIIY